MRKVAIAAAVVFAVIAIAGVGIAGASWMFQDSTTVRFSVDQPITRIAVDGRGDVDISASAGAAVQVERTTHAFLDEPDASWSVVNGVLHLEGGCGDDWAFFARCSVDYRIDVPEGIPIGVDTDHGDIDLRGATGDLSLATDHGDIEGRALAAAVVTAVSRHGDVELELTQPVDRVDGSSEHGDVDISLPAGTYRVGVSTNHGDTEVDGIVHDDRSPRSIVARTEHGDVTVSGR